MEEIGRKETAYPLSSYITRRISDILKPHVDKCGRSSEEFGMSFVIADARASLLGVCKGV